GDEEALLAQCQQVVGAHPMKHPLAVRLPMPTPQLGCHRAVAVTGECKRDALDLVAQFDIAAHGGPLAPAIVAGPVQTGHGAETLHCDAISSLDGCLVVFEQAASPLMTAVSFFRLRLSKLFLESRSPW